MKLTKGLIVIASASLIALTAVMWFVDKSVNQMNSIYKMFLDKDEVVRAYENHHGAKLGVYYKIQGYSGDSELPEHPRSFFVVTTVEFNSRGTLCENLELREIEVPKVQRKGACEIPDYLSQKYVVFEVVDNAPRMTYLRDDEDLTRHKLGIR
jgi:hypothetical protein